MASERTGVYPGTFDPITSGHMEVMRRSLRLVDRLVIGCAINIGKGPLFSLEERMEIIREDIADFLTSRCGLGRDRFDLVSPAAPLRLETGLLRASALRFRQDYAAIGLHTFMTLSHPLHV